MTFNVTQSHRNPIEPDQQPHVLYLGNDQRYMKLLRKNTGDAYLLITSNSLIEAYNMARAENVQVIIAEQEMPGMSGIAFFESLSRDFPMVQRILLADPTDPSELMNAINKAKIFRALPMHAPTDEMNTAIAEAWETYKAIADKERTLLLLRRENAQFEFILRQRLLS